MKVKTVIFSIIIVLCCHPAAAQFYNAGEDDGSLKWSSIKTQNYRIVFPRNLDSLATIYAQKLEEVRTPVSAGLGYSPNGLRKRRMPVVMHPGTALANGMVGATPYQMDLYTVPNAYAPLAVPWESDLITHESRHAAQQQLGYEKRYGPFRFLIGDLFHGGMSALYGGLLFFEGDAVIAETSLSHSGRGRSADFLEYYMMAFENGDKRNFWQWRYGSQKYYTPNHYALGYITLAGTRALYDDPTLCKDFYGTITKHKLELFPFVPLRRTIAAAGGYNLDKNFNMIKSHFAYEWALAAEKRAPFVESEQLTEDTRTHTEYRGTQARDGRIWTIRNSLNSTSELLCITPDGKAQRLAWLSSYTSKLALGGNRLYWSEGVPDIRWSLKSASCIWYCDIQSGEIGRLTKEGRLYNPAPSEDGRRIAAANYPETGGSSVDILDAASGALLERIVAPDGLQFVECAWVGDRLFANGITSGGFGIYELSGGLVQRIAGPWPYQIKELRSGGNSVLFVCDASGVNEIYSLDSGTLELRQLSSSRFGSAEYALDGSSLLFGTLSPSGRQIYRASEVLSRPADFNGMKPHRTAEVLSEQDAQSLAGAKKDTALLSPIRNYSKLTHLFRIHSWAPLNVDYDEVKDISLENIVTLAGLGGTVFFQNDLGTSSGSASIEFLSSDRVAGHLKMTYKGLFPAFEGSLNVNSLNRSYYNHLVLPDNNYISSHPLSGVGVSGQLKTYVPLDFSRGGWKRGLIPQVRYVFSNSVFNSSDVLLDYRQGFTSEKRLLFTGVQDGPSVMMHRIYTSVRGYNILNIAPSNIFPRLGIGAEAGYSFRPVLTDILAPVSYAHVYGYVPGICPSHGVKMTSTFAHSIGDGQKEAVIYVTPRGFAHCPEAESEFARKYGDMASFTVDYAMPVLPVDWRALGPLLYVKNFELIPHADFSYYGGNGSGSLYSIGTSFNAVLSNLPAEVRAGITCSWNGGSLIGDVKEICPDFKRFYVGLSMGVDL